MMELGGQKLCKILKSMSVNDFEFQEDDDK